MTHRFAPDTDATDVAAFLAEHGYAIVERVVDDAVMDRFAAEVAPYVEASSTGRDVYDGRFTRRTGSLIARCPTARELVMDPMVPMSMVSIPLVVV